MRERCWCWASSGESPVTPRTSRHIAAGNPIQRKAHRHRNTGALPELLPPAAAARRGARSRAARRKAQRQGRSALRRSEAAAGAGLRAADPELFFLDEPTTGLDPQSRRQLWDLIEEVKRAGRTVVITTHYMEEAERLCDRVAIDHGKVIALGTPEHRSLRWGSAHHRIQRRRRPAVQPTSRPAVPHRCRLAPAPRSLSLRRQEDSYLLESAEAHRTIPALLMLLGARGFQLARLRTHSATLEDVFVHLTGRTLRDG